jgi:hypothetical protein
VNIKDVEIGMCMIIKNDVFDAFDVGDNVVVQRIIKESSNVVVSDSDEVYFEECHIDHLSKAYKFEVGDEVIFHFKGFNFDAILVGIADKADHRGMKYAISFKNENGDLVNMFAMERELFYKKQADELVAGDRFWNEEGKKCEVIFVSYDYMVEKVDYYCRVVSVGATEGMTVIASPDEIKEIEH